MCAPMGIRHGRATVTFEYVELARDLYEYEGHAPTEIKTFLLEACGLAISINTLNDWLYFRTRCAA